jgi:cytochrome c-type biogenesis protein CcmH/NrfF
MPAFDLKDQTASFHVVINPLVNWIWVGFAVMAFGTGIALLPERAYAFAVARLPAEAASTTALTVLLLLLAAGTARAQHVETGQSVPIIARTPLEREMQHSIICMCRGCGRQLLSECQCGMAADMRRELAGLVASGKTRNDIVKYYIAKYGSQEPLAQPIDEGFNRLAWAVPYALGATGLFVVGMVAARWSRRSHPTSRPATAEPTEPIDPKLAQRLDDELSDLD